MPEPSHQALIVGQFTRIVQHATGIDMTPAIHYAYPVAVLAANRA